MDSCNMCYMRVAWQFWPADALSCAHSSHVLSNWWNPSAEFHRHRRNWDRKPTSMGKTYNEPQAKNSTLYTQKSQTPVDDDVCVKNDTRVPKCRYASICSYTRIDKRKTNRYYSKLAVEKMSATTDFTTTLTPNRSVSMNPPFASHQNGTNDFWVVRLRLWVVQPQIQ